MGSNGHAEPTGRVANPAQRMLLLPACLLTQRWVCSSVSPELRLAGPNGLVRPVGPHLIQARVRGLPRTSWHAVPYLSYGNSNSGEGSAGAKVQGAA